MAFNRNGRFFRDLQQQILRDESSVIPFVGAGLSHYGVGSDKLPLWRQLIVRMRSIADELGVLDETRIKEVDKLLSEGSLIAATDLLVDAIGPKQFRDFVRTELNIDLKPLSPAALSLVVIGWSIIVTTNLDKTLEAAHELRHGKAPPVVTHRQTSELIEAIASPESSNGMVLAKLHGTIDDFASWCLTEKHYQALLNSPAYVETLRSLFLKRIFFIGFGLSDLDFDLIQDYLSRIFPDGDAESYALVPSFLKGGERLNRLIAERGLKPIFYDVDPTPAPDDPWGGHGEMFECLSILADSWVQSNAELKISMKHFGELDQHFIGRESEILTLDSIVFERNRSVQVIGFGGEGKTTLIQRWLRMRIHELQSLNFKTVFGFSFYSGSPDRFIDEAFMVLGGGDSSWDLARRLRYVCEAVAVQRILFVLDGLEIVLSQDGFPENPYLREFMAAVERSDSRIVITSRTEVQGPYSVLILNPMNPTEVERLFKIWGKSQLHPAEREAISRRARGHALSLRIAVSMADDLTGNEPTQPWDDTDAYDQLRFNKLQQTLAYYQSILSKDENAFLICFSVFERPTRFDLIDKVFSSDIVGFTQNDALKEVDLRSTIRSLLAKRLLIATGGNLLTAHPNVRDYFRAFGINLGKLHEALLREIQSRVKTLSFDSIASAADLFDICHHAAGAGLWTEFHLTYKDVIMRDHEDYLCDNIGAWAEALELTKKAFPNEDTSQLPVIAPTYYLSRYARDLKHLGQASKAEAAYLRVIALCADIRDPETALYLNNFLTLQLYRGRLDQVHELACWNIRLLSWIDVDWKKRWQVEHGAYSIAWYCGLKGDFSTAETLFEIAENAWNNSETTREEVFDHYPIYLAEVFRCIDPTRTSSARAIINRYLDAGLKNKWPETVVRAYLALAQDYRFLASEPSSESDRQKAQAQASLDKAFDMAKHVFAPPLRVELLIERCRQAFDQLSTGMNLDAIKRDLTQLDELMDALDWRLYEPERVALEGRLALLMSDKHRAYDCVLKAVKLANSQGHILCQISPVQSIQPLAVALGHKIEANHEELSGSLSHLTNFKHEIPTPTELTDALSNRFTRFGA